MNILLVYPKPNISFDTTNCLPLGMGYIAAVLEKQGHDVAILDLNVQQDDLEKRVSEVDVLGVYAMTPAIKAAWNICSRAKAANPSVVTILGGPHPSVLPEESLQKDYVDFVVRNEGEYTFAELCDRLAAGRSAEDVNGISHKRDGEFLNNPSREYIKNLDELPLPGYHLFPFDSYNPTRPTWTRKKSVTPGTIITSRGCPFTCVFCFKGVHGTQYRYRSPRSVVDEIKFLIENYNIDFLEFQDDAFNLIPERTLQIFKLMVEEGIDIKWSIPNGISRVDKVNEEFLLWAKKAGCVDIWFAVESGSQDVLDRIIGKGTTLEQVKNAVKLSKDLGFTVGGFVCIGNLGETREDIQRSIDFACELDLDRCQFTIATPYPGSRLYDLIKADGEFSFDDWDHWGPYELSAFYEHGETTRQMVEEMYKKAFRQFYLRPRYIWKALTNVNTYANLPLILGEIWRFMVQPRGTMRQ